MSFSRLPIWTMSVSTASTSPPTPSTPPPAPTPLDPEVRVTLPTPSSFSSRRTRSNSSDPESSPKDTAKSHGRSVSFSLDHGDEQDHVQKLYRIPQKKASTPTDNSNRAPVPPPLTLTTSRSALPLLSPFTRAPATAPHSRFTHTAAARGLSIAPALSRGARHSISGAQGSIWSATGYTTNKTGWASPALNSAKSIGTAARHRGLTVAVLKDDKDLIVGDVPLTPGLHTGMSTVKSSEESVSADHGEDEPNRKQDKREGGLVAISTRSPPVIILCRYYHTPGLTCTSRPCRFVHNLDAIKSPKPAREYEMLSPEAKDPTEGTFAQAQLRAKTKILDLDELVTKGAVPGETVVLSGENGHEVTGTVYLMSGGGKGPAGKSRAKFKSTSREQGRADYSGPL